MTTFDWRQIRESAIRRFHDAPDGALEQRILDVFREHPALVVEAVAHISARYEAGKIRSPWVILAQHVEQAVTPLENVRASDTRDRGKAIQRAEQWMHAAGKHFDVWAEVEDELLGERGMLHAWANDEPLRQRTERLWEEVRPEGERIEREAEERALRWAASRLPVTVPPDDDIPF